MAQYKYATHPNVVLVREWCNENRGRGKTLSEQLFPNIMHPGGGLAKYKCGEQFIDDDMLERAKVIMKEIEDLEKQGKRKIYKTKLAGPKLETNKNEHYAEIEKTQEYRDYVNFHHSYFIHADLFMTQLGFELPLTPGPSNLVSRKFTQLLKKAKQMVAELSLAPCTSPRVYSEVKKKNMRIEKIRAARESLDDVQRRIAVQLTPREEFEAVVGYINDNEKLRLLAPVILYVNYALDGVTNDTINDLDLTTTKAEEVYTKFTNLNLPFSLVKLVRLKEVQKKGLAMIGNGWLDDYIIE